MPDIIQLPKVSANILGTSYPVLSANVDVQIDQLMTFSVTVTTSDAKDGGRLTVNMIRKLAARAQNAIYKEPKESNITLNISGFKGNVLNLEGILTSVDVYASTSGGLTCTIGAISNDALLTCTDHGIYTEYVNTQKASEKIYKQNKLAKVGLTYVMALPNSQRDAFDDSVAKRMLNLITCAQSKWESFSQLDDQPDTVKRAIKSVEAINEDNKDRIKKFLTRSDKTSKIFDGRVKLNEATSNQVMNGLHTLLFDSGNNFLEAVLAACGEYELWYLPKLGKKGLGYLENCKFGNEDSSGACHLYCTGFQFSSGNRWLGKPPCIGVLMRSQAYLNVGAQVGAQNKTAASRTLTGSFPEKPKKDFGAIYMYQAPGWVTLPLLSTEEANTATQSTSEQFEAGNLKKTTREKTAPKINYQAKITKQKPSIQRSGDILTYLAEKAYYRNLLLPSTAEASGASCREAG